MDKENCPIKFSEVLHAELDVLAEMGRKEIKTEKQQPDATQRAKGSNLAGLAFSGGGIRSATFNLGVLQGLAEKKKLSYFDYLSTVSGGGYIGAWFSAWLNREPQGNIDAIQKKIGGPCEFGREAEEVSWLRSYSNYLTPKKGLSGDTLAAIGTWLRNTLLNQAMLALFFSLLLLFPQLWLLSLPKGICWIVLGIAFLGYAIYKCAKNLPQPKCCNQVSALSSPALFDREPTKIVFAALASAWFLAFGLSAKSIGAKFDFKYALIWGFAVGIVYGGLWLLSYRLKSTSCEDTGERDPDVKEFKICVVLFGILSGFVGGLLIYLLASYIENLPEEGRHWWASGFGTPLLLVIFCMTVMLHQGLMSRLFRVSQLEWWARLGGYVLFVAAAWAGIHALLVYVPPLIEWLDNKYIAAGGLVWLAHSAAGILFGKGLNTGGKDSVQWKEWVTRAAPYVFVLGYLAAISYGVHYLMSLCTKEGHVPGLHFNSYYLYLSHALNIKNNSDIGILWAVFAVGVFVFLLMARRVDVNLFSIHHFYRNRLTRCYLGASNKGRNPHPFTGFDPCDDIRMAELKQRPLHLINTTINLVHDNELAWQDRKAASFTFSPSACGFENSKPGSQHFGGYVKSKDYMNGVRMGTAVAASGAAASPNMGFHSSPPVAFLLTLFNVRLGHWCPNTAVNSNKERIKRDSPPFGGGWLLREMFGFTDDQADYVYLSDGGHFENLGVYELVRRRCRHILVVDAGQDSKRSFDDLANLIRKCYTDFGVCIEINLDDLRIGEKEVFSQNCWALGDIRYPDGEPGVLLYVKPSIIKGVPEDILNYAKGNSSFPHQSTGDQFFDEAQFESYRHLGYFLITKVMEDVDKGRTPQYNRWTLFNSPER